MTTSHKMAQMRVLKWTLKKLLAPRATFLQRWSQIGSIHSLAIYGLLESLSIK